jgi:hypothetical protein
MTADEWLTSTRPDAMLKAITAKASGRKHRLIACAICRLVEDRIPDPRLTAAVGAAEQYAENRLGIDDFRTAAGAVELAFARISAPLPWDDDPLTQPGYEEYVAAAAAQGATLDNPVTGADQALQWAGQLAELTAPTLTQGHAADQFRSAACEIVREIIGPLAHPLVLMSGWLLRYAGGPAAAFRSRISGTARGIAEAVADESAFDKLPILADALEDAGLDDRPVLDHLRHGTGHARGCWALDLVLGRA